MLVFFKVEVRSLINMDKLIRSNFMFIAVMINHAEKT